MNQEEQEVPSDHVPGQPGTHQQKGSAARPPLDTHGRLKAKGLNAELRRQSSQQKTQE